jgi:nucleotide-binding universal stress UspA family protein
MKTIVVGMTAQETAQKAVQQAVDLAVVLGASIHFVTAISRDDTFPIGEGGGPSELSGLQQARRLVEARVAAMKLPVESAVHVEVADPADLLIEVARAESADLIVVGNVRMQGIGRLLGSVGNDVAHRAPCSVLIVKTV